MLMRGVDAAEMTAGAGTGAGADGPPHFGPKGAAWAASPPPAALCHRDRRPRCRCRLRLPPLFRAPPPRNTTPR
jgi:hypothetical protein